MKTTIGAVLVLVLAACGGPETTPAPLPFETATIAQDGTASCPGADVTSEAGSVLCSWSCASYDDRTIEASALFTRGDDGWKLRATSATDCQ